MIKADWAKPARRRTLATGDPRLGAEGGGGGGSCAYDQDDDDKENCDLWRVKNGRNLSTASGAEEEEEEEENNDFEAAAPKFIEILLT